MTKRSLLENINRILGIIFSIAVFMLVIFSFVEGPLPQTTPSSSSFVATPTPVASPTLDVQKTLKAVLAARPSSTPLPFPTNTSTPTSTPTRTPLPPTATSTTTPTPTSTATPTLPPTSTYTPTPSFSGEMFTELRVSASQDPLTFEWTWRGPPLEKEKYGFEVRVGKDIQAINYGLHNAALEQGKITLVDEDTHQLEIVMTGTAGDLGSGNYYWKVILIQISPEYTDTLGIASAPGTFQFNRVGTSRPGGGPEPEPPASCIRC